MFFRYVLRPAAAAPFTTIPFDSAWDDTTDAVRRLLDDDPFPADTQVVGTARTWTPGDFRLDRQFVGRALPPGLSFDGASLYGSTRFAESDADDNAVAACGFRLFTPDLELAKVLLPVGVYGPGTEFGTTSVARVFAKNALAPYVTQGGEIPVFELGFTDVVGTTPQATASYGGALHDYYVLAAQGSSSSFTGWMGIGEVNFVGENGAGAFGGRFPSGTGAWRLRYWGDP
jgi:hypothetical protein